MDKLDLSSCNTNYEVSSKIKERVLSVEVNKVVNDLSESFVFQEETIKKLYAALSTGNNILLYGPGGFSKSVITKAFCKYFGIPVVTKVGYKDMNPEELLGIPNMKKLLEESKYETAFENSVFCIKGVMICEEFGDVNEGTIAALKDLITERGFREGNTFKESMISSIIITSNKNPEELAVSDTTKALYKERFPIRHNTVWKTFTKRDYKKYIQTVHPGVFVSKPAECELICKLCSDTSTIVSPRIVSVAVSIMDKLGVDMLSTVSDINTKSLSDYSEKLHLDKEYYNQNKALTNIKTKLDSIIIDDKNLIKSQATIIELDEKLSNIKVVDRNWNIYQTIKLSLVDKRDKINTLFKNYAYGDKE